MNDTIQLLQRFIIQRKTSANVDVSKWKEVLSGEALNNICLIERQNKRIGRNSSSFCHGFLNFHHSNSFYANWPNSEVCTTARKINKPNRQKKASGESNHQSQRYMVLLIRNATDRYQQLQLSKLYYFPFFSSFHH